ncbi:MAG: isochorismatase family cysteine hydrolase [Erysipelotrichaceae bacterium]|nr:isochorismatase family cysteine hydrolase [Erysipelotrichaceae bacterium]
MKNIDQIKKLLIIVDMIKGFVNNGPMADIGISHVIPEQLRLIELIKTEEDGIAFIKDVHDRNCREFKRYPQHCVANTAEAELVDELLPYETEALVYPKNSTCALFNPHFLPDLKKMTALQEIVIVGCCTDICVMNLAIPLQNYLDEHNRDLLITIPMDAVETYHAPGHDRAEYNEMAFKLLRQAGINLIEHYGSTLND